MLADGLVRGVMLLTDAKVTKLSMCIVMKETGSEVQT